MSVSTAFDGVGNEPGVAVWRLENFEPVSVPKSDFGKFYSGDSYIVLNTEKTETGKLTHDVFFWLGAETTQDESTAAAMLTVQLDDALGGGAVQHRELGGQESAEFMEVFPGIKVLKGGVATALHHAEEGVYTPKLIWVKSGKNIVAVEVPISIESLNSSDCFVLDTEEVVYLYQGEGASIKEKTKSMAVAEGFKNEEHSGECKVVVVDHDDTSSEEAVAFFSLLGVEDAASVTLSPAAAEPSSEEASGPPRLFNTSSGAFAEVKTTPLARTMLTSEGTFVVSGNGVVWVWTGKKVSADARALASEVGGMYVKQSSLPSKTPLKVVKEGLEPTLFKSCFGSWPTDEYKQYEEDHIPAEPLPEAEADQSEAAAETEAPFAAEEVEEVPSVHPVAPLVDEAAEDEDEEAPVPVVDTVPDVVPAPSTSDTTSLDLPTHSVPAVHTKGLHGGLSPLDTKVSEGEMNGGHVASEDLDQDLDVVERPKVSELAKKMYENDVVAKSTDYSPKHAAKIGERTWENGKSAEPVTPSSPAVNTPKASPVKVLTAHDTKNTANVALILQQGTFEKVPLQDFLPYDDLISMRLEDGIDVTRKEDYLDEVEFERVFSMTRDEFKKIPSWRQIQNKKKVALF